MKNTKQVLILFFLLYIGYSCTTQTKKHKNDEFTKCDSNLKLRNTIVNNDSIISIGQLYTNVLVHKNLKNQEYFVENSSGKILLKELNYFGRIAGGFQAINKENEIVFYDLKLKKLNQAPEPEFFGVCGNVSGWKVKIEEKENYYIVQKLEGHSGSFGSAKWQHVDSIPKLDSKDIYFLDKTKSIEFDENFYFPETIIIVYENSMGIRKNKKTFVFDVVDMSNLKVTCNGLFGYFERTAIKYKKLDSFEYNLAQFELPDGRKGYVDLFGNEYYR